LKPSGFTRKTARKHPQRTFISTAISKTTQKVKITTEGSLRSEISTKKATTKKGTTKKATTSAKPTTKVQLNRKV